MILLVLLLVARAFCCTVPVFHYALQRWRPDPYIVEVAFTQGKSIEVLKALSDKSNITINVTDTPYDPLIKVYLPQTDGPRQIVWQGPTNEDSVNQILHSPIRTEIANRLTDGQSAVWLLLECGNKQKDDTAAALLEKQVEILQQKIKLPEDKLEIPGGVNEQIDDDLVRIEFSTIRLSRNDPAEKLLVNTLLLTEHDLKTFTENSFYAMGSLFDITPVKLTVDDVLAIYENAYT